MKLSLIAPVLCILVLTTSCSRNLDSNDATSIATSGTWKVTLFIDSGNDETSDFTGYSFSFNSGGVVTASKNGVNKTGSWSSGSSKFNIDLGPKDDTNKPLGELTDDWRIISTSASEIKLKDDSNDEFLTFTRN